MHALFRADVYRGLPTKRAKEQNGLCRVPEDKVRNSGHAASNDSTIHVLEKISKEMVADNQGTGPVFVLMGSENRRKQRKPSVEDNDSAKIQTRPLPKTSTELYSCINPFGRDAQIGANTFHTASPNICVCSVWNLLRVTLF